nr:MFS transporter [Flexivirga meconopsidis]
MRESLEVLQERNFRWFFLSRSINMIGSMMTPVTLAFAVLHIDNSAGALGLVLAAQMGANVLFLLFGGVIADRLPRRAVMQGCYLAMAVIQGVMAASLAVGWATVGSMIVLGALSGGVTAFSMPAQQGLIPQLVGRHHLQQADSLMSFVRNGGTFVGPIVGTTLVVATGPALAIGIDASTFLIASVLLARVSLPSTIRRGTPILTELREGWGEFSSRTWLWVIVAAFGVLNAIHIGAWVVIGPVIAKNDPDLGIRGWGVVVGAEAVGMLVMSAVLLRVRLRHPLRAGMTGMSLFAIPLLMLGIRPATLPLMVVAFLSGMGTQTFSTGWTVAMMERIPSEVLSRVSSYDMLGSFVAIPVGTLTFGWLADRVDVETLLIVAGAAYATLSLATLLVPQVWGLRRQDDEPESSTVRQDLTKKA